MKKLFLMIQVLLFLASCSKTDLDDKVDDNGIQKNTLLKDLSEIIKLEANPNESSDLFLTNCDNPYDLVGVITGKTIIDALHKAKVKTVSKDALMDNFSEALNRTLNSYGFRKNETNYSPDEKVIINFFIDVYAREGFEIYRIKSKKMENIINNSPYFDDNQKSRILTFSSVLRHSYGSVANFRIEFSNKRSVSWEDCFVEKLRELQDCGNCWVERVVCAFSWPSCLGVKALDCLIETIT